jgi:metallopeptidase MepB
MGSVRCSRAAQLPPTFDSTSLSVKQEAQAMMQATRLIWDTVVLSVKVEEASFQSVILPIAIDENRRMERQRILQFFASISPSKELRDAATETSNMLSDGEVDLYSRRDIFILVDRVLVMSRSQHSPLDPQSQYFLEKLHRRFVQNGCGIEDEAKRADFKEKTKRLQHVIRECNRNLSEDKSGLWVTEDDLEGAPKSLIDRLKRGEGKFSGCLWLPTKVPFSQPAVSSSKKESTRRRIHYAVQNRMLSNILLFRELVLLRDDTARILGFSNHFERKTSGKMVRNPQMVEKLMKSVRGPIDGLAKEDAEELLKLKQQDNDESKSERKDKLFFWDLSYYTKRRAEKTGISDATLREYFELDTTIAKLMGMFEHLFGSHFVRAHEDGKEGLENRLIWHEDVRMYEVFDNDNDGDFLGYAYLDLFPRDGKYTHAGHYTLTRVRKLQYTRS